MLVRANIDDLFGFNTPAAVMRPEADSCLYERRQRYAYFLSDMAQRRGHSNKKMKGGINGGMILVKPDSEVYADMMNEFARFKPHT